MFRTDLLVNWVASFALQTTQWIGAPNIHFVPLNQLIPDFFDLNRGLSVSLSAQEMHTFPKNCNAGILPLRSFGRCCNEIAQEIPKSSRIRGVIEH